MLLSTPIERCIDRTISTPGLLGSVTKTHGLMPATAPATALPPSLRFVDDCIAELPRLFRRGRVCKALMELPAPSDEEIRRLAPEEMLRLSMAYGFMAYSFRYAWEHGRERLLHDGEAWTNASSVSDEERFAPREGTVARIRSSVLLPWRTVWQAMGREQPCFEGDFFTRNFRVLEGDYRGGESVGQDSCELLFRMFGNETERTFFLGVQEVTARFNCIPQLVRMQRAMAAQDHLDVVAAVDEVSSLWRDVVEDVFMRFDTRIDPADWAATVGTWTASPFPGRDGFSGMFFPAFHMLDVLLGRTRYESVMGKLITHTRGELLPAWRDLFAAIGEADLRTYCDAHGRSQPELLRALFRLQDAYQHFFLVHRRKVFAFEYQGIVTGRNSTNAGIAVDIKDRTVESVFSLATWNEIDDLLLESGMERPLERLSKSDKCPFSGAPLAVDAPKSFPPPVAVRCPFSGASASRSKQAAAPERASAELPSWRPLPPPSESGFHGIELASLPVSPRVGDRVALSLDADGKRKVEGDFVGPLVPPYVVRTDSPIRELHRVEILPGVFARQPGAGARARHTGNAPVIVLAQGRHSVVATTIASHARADLFVIVEGDPAEKAILTARGVPAASVAITPSLDDLPPDHAIRALRESALVYISGEPSFVKRANAWLESAFRKPHEPFTKFLSELRAAKRYRPIVQAGPPAHDPHAIMYPWDVVAARRYPLRVVLEGRVLDLTDFQALHLGGSPILRMLAGTDVTPEFSRAHPDGQIRMPDVHAVATFHVPAGLEKITQLAFIIARSSNVLGLIDEMLAPYRNSVRARTQRLCRILEALDAETLWSTTLARACGTEIQPGIQLALRANHARQLAVLENTLRSREMTDLSLTFGREYTKLYENLLSNLVRGLRESVPVIGKPVEVEALRVCFDRHVQILLEHVATTTVEHDLPSERTFAVDLGSNRSLPTLD